MCVCVCVRARVIAMVTTQAKVLFPESDVKKPSSEVTIKVRQINWHHLCQVILKSDFCSPVLVCCACSVLEVLKKTAAKEEVQSQKRYVPRHILHLQPLDLPQH